MHSTSNPVLRKLSLLDFHKSFVRTVGDTSKRLDITDSKMLMAFMDLSRSMEKTLAKNLFGEEADLLVVNLMLMHEQQTNNVKED